VREVFVALDAAAAFEATNGRGGAGGVWCDPIASLRMREARSGRRALG